MPALKHTTENQMYQILATHITDGQKIVITYGEKGYRDLRSDQTMPYSVPKEVEDSFIGGSIFGWDSPVADRAHEWVCEDAAERSAVNVLRSFKD